MRINAFIAQTTGLSRRAADAAIEAKRVRVNGQAARLGQEVTAADSVTLDNQPLKATNKLITIMLNKPIGYVVSRAGQSSRTIYELLPPELQQLKPVGRLDKDSSGLLLLTSDGQLAYELTHPKFVKHKSYEVTLNKPLTATDQGAIERGIRLDDGVSKLKLEKLDNTTLQVTMHEGRNRQIRRTFTALGYKVNNLHRIQFGSYKLAALNSGSFVKL